jgi:RHS repeat-associated protein
VASVNPYRYAGYRYDEETGLYLLQSRYYDPEFGRFISQDDPTYHDGMNGAAANLYAYANNNPVMNVDPSGHISWIHIWYGLSDLKGAIFTVLSYSVRGTKLYRGATYVAQITIAAMRNMMALETDADIMTAAMALQQYPLVVTLLAVLITLAITLPIASVTTNLKNALTQFRYAFTH